MALDAGGCKPKINEEKVILWNGFCCLNQGFLCVQGCECFGCSGASKICCCKFEWCCDCGNEKKMKGCWGYAPCCDGTCNAPMCNPCCKGQYQCCCLINSWSCPADKETPYTLGYAGCLQPVRPPWPS